MTIAVRPTFTAGHIVCDIVTSLNSTILSEFMVCAGAHIRKKFGGVSYVLGPTFVVFVFGKKSQLL